MIEVWSRLQRTLLTLKRVESGVSDCELVFEHRGDSANIHVRTMCFVWENCFICQYIECLL